MAALQPFYVTDVLARSRALEAQGRSIVHLEIGEPDFAADEHIVRAGRTHYLPALGSPALRALGFISRSRRREHFIRMRIAGVLPTTVARLRKRC